MTDPGGAQPHRRETTRTLQGTPPCCPRCGYDVSVSTQTWPADRCPTSGLCNECGLTFSWGAVLNPLRDGPWWFFETPRGVVGTLRAAFGTVLVALAPWVAMRGAPMTLKHRVGRAIALPAALLVLYYVLGILVAHTEEFLPVPPHRQPTWMWHAPAPQFPVLEESIFWPLFDARFAYAQMHWEHRPIASLYPVVIATHLVAMPLCFLVLPTTLRKYKVRRVHFVRLCSIGAACTLGLSIPLLFVRATIDALEYSNVFTVSARWLKALLEWEAFGWAGACFVLYLAWNAAFWWSACRWYLRLPSPMFHACVLWAMSVMVTVALLFWTWQPMRSLLTGLLAALH